MSTITYQQVKYTREQLVRKVEDAKRERLALSSGETTARAIIGTGYKNPTMVAREYTLEKVTRWETLLRVFDENMEGK